MPDQIPRLSKARFHHPLPCTPHQMRRYNLHQSVPQRIACQFTLADLRFYQSSNVLHEREIAAVADEDEFAVSVFQQSREFGYGRFAFDARVGVAVTVSASARSARDAGAGVVCWFAYCGANLGEVGGASVTASVVGCSGCIARRIRSEHHIRRITDFTVRRPLHARNTTPASAQSQQAFNRQSLITIPICSAIVV